MEPKKGEEIDGNSIYASDSLLVIPKGIEDKLKFALNISSKSQNNIP